MQLSRTYIVLIILLITAIVACKHKADNNNEQAKPVAFKGLYSLESGSKIFQPCGKQTQYWVADSSAQLELKYSQVVAFEQTGQQVYIEVEGKKIKSAAGAAFDSTLVVKKVIKLTKDIPADCK